MKLVINQRNKELGTLEIDPSAQLEDLQNLFVEKIRKLPVNQIRFTIPSQAVGRRQPPIEHDKPLSSFGLKDGEVIEFKNLGKQLGWRLVYVIEYVGPLVFYPLFFLRPEIIYGAGASKEVHLTQWLALAAWMGHYIKRELETLFVHHWGPRATMPVFNVFRNSMYYWGITIPIAYYMNHPLYTSPPLIYVVIGFAGFVISEILNAVVHIQLSQLRTPGTRERKIPQGPLFYLVSCPNYTTEAFSWIFFNIATWTVAGIAFFIMGAYQMTMWALDRQKRYREQFKGTYPRRRKAMWPFIL